MNAEVQTIGAIWNSATLTWINYLDCPRPEGSDEWSPTPILIWFPGTVLSSNGNIEARGFLHDLGRIVRVD